MSKKLIWIFAILAIGGALAAGAWWYTFHKPALNVFDEKAVYNLSAADLLNQFTSNESQADSMYVGKVISVEGTIAAINTIESRVEVSLEDEMMGVICLIDSAYAVKQISEIKALKSGDKVKMKGKCNGYLMDVRLDNCVIEK